MAFLTKNKKIYRDVVAYYIIDGDLYQLSMRNYFTEADSKLPSTEIFNKYGCHLSKYNFIYDEFGKKKFHKELRKIVITLNCQRCDTEKSIPKKYFKD